MEIYLICRGELINWLLAVQRFNGERVGGWFGSLKEVELKVV